MMSQEGVYHEEEVASFVMGIDDDIGAEQIVYQMPANEMEIGQEVEIEAEQPLSPAPMDLNILAEVVTGNFEVCDYCGASFIARGGLIAHINKMHQRDSRRPDRVSGPVSAEVYTTEELGGGDLDMSGMVEILPVDAVTLDCGAFVTVGSSAHELHESSGGIEVYENEDDEMEEYDGMDIPVDQDVEVYYRSGDEDGGVDSGLEEYGVSPRRRDRSASRYGGHREPNRHSRAHDSEIPGRAAPKFVEVLQPKVMKPKKFTGKARKRNNKWSNAKEHRGKKKKRKSRNNNESPGYGNLLVEPRLKQRDLRNDLVLLQLASTRSTTSIGAQGEPYVFEEEPTLKIVEEDEGDVWSARMTGVDIGKQRSSSKSTNRAAATASDRSGNRRKSGGEPLDERASVSNRSSSSKQRNNNHQDRDIGFRSRKIDMKSPSSRSKSGRKMSHMSGDIKLARDAVASRRKKAAEAEAKKAAEAEAKKTATTAIDAASPSSRRRIAQRRMELFSLPPPEHSCRICRVNFASVHRLLVHMRNQHDKTSAAVGGRQKSPVTKESRSRPNLSPTYALGRRGVPTAVRSPAAGVPDRDMTVSAAWPAAAVESDNVDEEMEAAVQQLRFDDDPLEVFQATREIQAAFSGAASRRSFGSPRHRGGRHPPTLTSQTSILSDSSPTECRLCSLEFENHRLYALHMKEEHGTRVPGGLGATMPHVEHMMLADDPIDLDQAPEEVCGRGQMEPPEEQGIVESRQRSAKSAAASSPRPILCMVCLSGFDSEEARRDHNLDNHGGIPLSEFSLMSPRHGEDCSADDDIGPPGFPESSLSIGGAAGDYWSRCEMCYVGFTSLLEYSEHMKTLHVDVYAPFPCSHCTARLRTKEAYDRHCQKAHGLSPQGAQYMCDECGERFHRRARLTNHQRQVHTSPDRRCATCGKVFASPADRSAHSCRKLQAAKQTSFECRMCTKVFSNRPALRRHEASHDDATPFACDKCPQRFKVSDHLRRHQRSIHEPHVRAAVQPCSYCGKTLSTLKSLRKHMKLHTAGKAIVAATASKPKSQKRQKPPKLPTEPDATEQFIAIVEC